MAPLNFVETLPITEPMIGKRLVDGLVVTLLVGVEVAWLAAFVAAVVWLLVLR